MTHDARGSQEPEDANIQHIDDDDDESSLSGVIGLIGAGAGLLAIPYFTGDRWVWMGISTDYVAYAFLAIGIVWLPFAIKGHFSKS